MLDQVVLHPLDLAAVLAASGHERSLGRCHTHHGALSGPERLHGARIATVQPKTWDGADNVRVLDLSP